MRWTSLSSIPRLPHRGAVVDHRIDQVLSAAIALSGAARVSAPPKRHTSFRFGTGLRRRVNIVFPRDLLMLRGIGSKTLNRAVAGNPDDRSNKLIIGSTSRKGFERSLGKFKAHEMHIRDLVGAVGREA